MTKEQKSPEGNKEYERGFKDGHDCCAHRIKLLEERESRVCDRCELLLKALESTNAIVWPSEDEIKKATKDYATLKLYGFDEVIPSRYDAFKAGVNWFKQRLNGGK